MMQNIPQCVTDCISCVLSAVFKRICDNSFAVSSAAKGTCYLVPVIKVIADTHPEIMDEFRYPLGCEVHDTHYDMEMIVQ